VANTWTTTKKGAVSWEELEDAIVSQAGLEGFAEAGAWNDAGLLNTGLAANEF
jgi:hypothetical protein